MLSLSAYLAESPHETDSVVNIAVYFPQHKPEVQWQPRIPDIVNAVKSGKLKPRRMRIALKSLVPTQNTVSQTKVLTQADLPAWGSRPLVCVERGKNILLDGHHRACAEVVAGEASADCDVLTSQQIDAWAMKAAA